jgi:DNA-binding SARP family transcriptional activator/tetratricopeptide (TPR) repeat protein
MENRTTPAKITRPRPGDTYARARLFKWLDRAQRRPLIWVSGSPGSGKTLLIADYLARRRIRTLWYQADGGDADLATFFHYLTLAANRLAPRPRHPLPAFTPDRLDDLERFARAIFNALFARIKPPFALVLDNYQEIPAGTELHDVLRVAVETLPAGGHIIGISRMGPPPILARTRLNDAMMLLDDAALRLTVEEAQGIARLRAPGRRNRQLAAALHEITHGWAAGLVLMLEHAETALPAGQAAFKTPGVLFEYFANEVFAKLDPDTRHVLLGSVFLPSMTAHSVAALTGERRAGRILNHLSQNNFFTTRYQLEETVYQYHPLFREFLLSRARRLPPDAFADLRRRAAAVLEESGDHENALTLFQSLGDGHGMERCLQRLAPELLQQGRKDVLEQWLEKLPAEQPEQSPWPRYWLGVCRLPRDPQASRRLFETSLDRFRDLKDGDGARAAWSGIIDAILLEGVDFQRLHQWIETYPILPASDNVSAVTGLHVATSMLNALVLADPRHAEIGLWSERILKLLKSPAAQSGRVISAAMHVVLRQLLIGEGLRAGPILHQLEALAHTPSLSCLKQIKAHTTVATIHWLATAASDAAARQLQEALTLAEKSGVHQWDQHLLAQATATALTAYDLEAAEDWLDRLARTQSGARPVDISFYHYLANWLALARGDLVMAQEHLVVIEKMFPGLGLWFAEALAEQARAQTLLQAGHADRASAAIQRVLGIAEETGSHYFRFLGLLLETQRLLDTGRDDEAPRILADAFALGKRQGLINFHGWLPRVMTRLATRALEAGIETGYVRELIVRRALPPGEEARDLETWPWPLKIYTFGRLSILKDDQPLRPDGRAQSRPLELLAALIAHGGRGIPEETLAELLWPDAEGDAAHRAFDTTLHRLRKLLGNERALILTDGKLSLNPAICWVDVWTFERLLGRLDVLLIQPKGQDVAAAVARVAQRILALYRGTFLGQENDAVWSISARERLRSKCLCQLGALGRFWESARDWERAAQTYHKAIDIQADAEEYYQRLMRAYHALGRSSETAAVYRRCRETLLATCNREPSATTEAVRRELTVTA